MNPSLKKITIFGLAGGLGKIIRDQIMDHEKKEEYFSDLTQDEICLMLWHCDQIEAAGQKAMAKAKVKKDRSKVRQAERKIIEAAGTVGEIDVLRMLSFLFLGLAELEHFSRDKEIIREVREATLNFMTLYDPNLELDTIHAEAMGSYERWVA